MSYKDCTNTMFETKETNFYVGVVRFSADIGDCSSKMELFHKNKTLAFYCTVGMGNSVKSVEYGKFAVFELLMYKKNMSCHVLPYSLR